VDVKKNYQIIDKKIEGCSYAQKEMVELEGGSA